VTASQELRLQGFNASLQQRGVLLGLLDTDFTFTALVEKAEPDRSEFSLSNETRDFSKVHILRTTANVNQIEVGSVLNEAATVHRVTRVEDHPSNIVVIFHCETAAQ
jgi:hypothetical protein